MVEIWVKMEKIGAKWRKFALKRCKMEENGIKRWKFGLKWRKQDKWRKLG